MNGLGRDQGRRWRRLPGGLLGMLALVLGVEHFVARHDLDFGTDWAADRRFSARLAERAGPGSAVLCLGDSQVKYGVLPAVLGERLGRPALNLAVHGGQPPSSYLLLRRALEAGARPTAVVVDFQPGLLRNPPQQYERPWSELAGLREAFDLARTARDARFFGAVVAGRLLPTARARFELRANVRAALAGSEVTKRFDLAAQRRNWARNRGAQVMPAGQYYHVPFERLGEFQGDWSCDPVNAAYLARLIDLAESRGIAVFWLLAPLTTEVQSEIDRSGFDASFLRFVAKVQARHPGLVVVDGRRSGYDRAAFIDPVHLNRQGATALSLDLADLIAHHLADPTHSPRQWSLPTFHPRPDVGPAEDVVQSRLALQQAEGSAARR